MKTTKKYRHFIDYSYQERIQRYGSIIVDSDNPEPPTVTTMHDMNDLDNNAVVGYELVDNYFTNEMAIDTSENDELAVSTFEIQNVDREDNV